ncbi:hypothetical protein ACNPNN_20735 [Stenotrophomonas geniculata]|uniref:hypothetical protein n=1 Tax=Stenotrophomonas geniculata TaxID=86188 RepID=UPI003AAAF277
MGGSTTIDFGKIKRSRLHAEQAALLLPQQRGVTVTCRQPEAIALQQSGGEAQDDSAAIRRLGLTPGTSRGLGLAGTKPLGAFVLRWRQDTATLDGTPVRLIVSSDGGAVWRDFDAATNSDATDLIAWARDGQMRPASGRVMTLGIQIEAAIAPLSTLSLGQEAVLTGTVSLLVIPQ